jgi:hypothetical protein
MKCQNALKSHKKIWNILIGNNIVQHKVKNFTIMLLPENPVGICLHRLNNGKLKFKIKNAHKKKKMVILNNNISHKLINLRRNL